MNFKDLGNGSCEGFALVKSVDKKNTKTGGYYLDLMLADKTGEINGKIWDWREGNFMPEIGSIIKVRGTISTYNNTLQMKIDRARDIWESDNVSFADIVPSADYTGDFMLNEIVSLVKNFDNTELKTLVLALIEKYEDKLYSWPAAFKLHHAIRGGLLMHTLSIVRMCQSVAALYPTVDEELLISGAILHDIAKTDEFTVTKVGLADGYSVKGQLLGHLVMGAMAVEETGKELGTDEETLMLLEHMLISHHGVPEYGAAVRPAFLEAEILSQLDDLDAKIYEFENTLQNVNVGEFSSRQWSLDDRKLFNHGRKKPETKVNFYD